MKRVLTAVILIPIVVLALFRAPLWLFALLVLGVALLAAREYFDIAEKTGFRPMEAQSYVSLTALFLIVTLVAYSNVFNRPGSSGHAIRVLAIFSIIVVVASPYVSFALALRRAELRRSLGDAAVSICMLAYVGVPLALLPLIRDSEGAALFLLFSMLLVWCGDIAALYVGRAVGKHKLAPRISPGKTLEGAIASASFAMLLAIVLFHWVNPIAAGLTRIGLMREDVVLGLSNYAHAGFPVPPIWFALVFGLCINIAAQMGDLVESALKRGAGVKDSGALLPGHGGVLDRIDALLFAMPVTFVFFRAFIGYFETQLLRPAP